MEVVVDGERLFVLYGTYPHSGSTKILLYDAKDSTPYATATYNIPGLPSNLVAVKKEQSLVDALQKAGILGDKVEEDIFKLRDTSWLKT